MTSLKKPLIAIASAVVLATTTLMAAPASAATVAISGGNWVTASATDGTTAAKAVTLPVPADNSVDAPDVLTIAVSAAVAGSTVTATATNAKIVTALATASAPVTAAAGAATASVPTGTGTTATIYVYTTTTSGGSVAVTADGNTTTYYVKGSAGAAYALTASVPTVAGLGVAVPFTATVADVFGNAVENATITTSVLRGSVTTALAWDATDKRYEGAITTPTVAGTVNGISTISATDVTGLAKAVKEVSFSIAAADLATQVTTLSADVVAKTAEISSLKAKYNSLVKKYNKKVAKKYQVKTIK